MLDSIEGIIQELKAKELLTQKNVSDLRRFISIKYPNNTEESNALVFADAVKRILHIKLSEVSKEYRNEIIQILLKNTACKVSFAINAQDAFEACLGIETNKESFLDEVAQWVENLLEKPILKEVIKSYAGKSTEKANFSGISDDIENSPKGDETEFIHDAYSVPEAFDAVESIISTGFQESTGNYFSIENDIDKPRRERLNPEIIYAVGEKLESLYKYLLYSRITALQSFIQKNRPMLGKLAKVRVYGPAVLLVFTVILAFGLMNSKNEAETNEKEAFMSSTVSNYNNTADTDIDSNNYFVPLKLIPRSGLAQNNKTEESKSDLLDSSSEKKSNPIKKIVSRSDKESVTSKKTDAPKIDKYKKKLVMKATAYDLSVESCSKTRDHPQYGITKSGTRATLGRTVAVDPLVIPLGSKLYIEFPESYKDLTGYYIAEDTGSLIKGEVIDIFFGEDKPGERVVYNKAKKFGVQKVTVYVIE